MKYHSHLIVRLTSQTQFYDFVELCASDLVETQNPRVTERDRKQVSATFNSLSKALV